MVLNLQLPAGLSIESFSNNLEKESGHWRATHSHLTYEFGLTTIIISIAFMWVNQWHQLGILIFTKQNDEDIGHGEGDQIVVHGTVKSLALDYHNDDWEVPEESTEEDNHVEDGHEPEQILKYCILTNIFKYDILLLLSKT